MRLKKRIRFEFGLVAVLGLLMGGGLACSPGDPRGKVTPDEPASAEITGAWSGVSGNRKGKVIFAQPPKLVILNLSTGIKREVPGVTVE
ncbi:MAG: hypothetical protein GY940_34170, partial [bacterium]|nr:hypothetical protein [bacterium]